MAGQRQIKREQFLYFLIQTRREKAEGDIFEVTVNESVCKVLGAFNYRNKITGKKRMGDLFLINETQNGNNINIIYDDKGDVIAWQSEEDDMELHIAKDIELDKELLERQLELGEERSKRRRNMSDSRKGRRRKRFSNKRT